MGILKKILPELSFAQKICIFINPSFQSLFSLGIRLSDDSEPYYAMGIKIPLAGYLFNDLYD